MFDDWSTLWTVLAVVAGIFVTYWVAMFFLVGYAQRDLERRGIAGWLSYAFLISTPLGLILWLIARKFFPVQSRKPEAVTTTARRGLRG
jgi:MFS family permease